MNGTSPGGSKYDVNDTKRMEQMLNTDGGRWGNIPIFYAVYYSAKMSVVKYMFENNDIDLKKTDKLLKIVLFAAVFELLFKHNNPKKVIISEYVLASEYFLEKVQIGYLNAILDKISKVIRKDE